MKDYSELCQEKINVFTHLEFLLHVLKLISLFQLGKELLVASDLQKIPLSCLFRNKQSESSNKIKIFNKSSFTAISRCFGVRANSLFAIRIIKIKKRPIRF